MDMDTQFNLERGDGGTRRWRWEADVRIAGPVGSMGQRVLQPIVNQQVENVLTALDKQVASANVSVPVTGEEFVAIMSAFPTGVAIVTAVDLDERPRGLTTNAVTSASLAPPILLVCLDLTSRTLPAVRRSGRFAVNFMSAGCEAVCRKFAEKADDKFDHVRWTPGVGGVPLLSGHAVAIRRVRGAGRAGGRRPRGGDGARRGGLAACCDRRAAPLLPPRLPRGRPLKLRGLTRAAVPHRGDAADDGAARGDARVGARHGRGRDGHHLAGRGLSLVAQARHGGALVDRRLGADRPRDQAADDRLGDHLALHPPPRAGRDGRAGRPGGRRARAASCSGSGRRRSSSTTPSAATRSCPRSAPCATRSRSCAASSAASAFDYDGKVF